MEAQLYPAGERAMQTQWALGDESMVRGYEDEAAIISRLI